MSSVQPVRRFLVLLASVAFALMVLASTAGAHEGHEGHHHGEGRLPGQPDLQRIGKTTYRFKPGLEEYEIRRPDAPPSLAHVDFSEGEVFPAGPAVPLPSQELAPICRTSGNRIVVVYSHRPSETGPSPAESLRSIVRRMNWKINQQGSLSSGGGRTVQMAIDCTSGGTIQVHDVTSADGDFATVFSAASAQLFGNPTGTSAIKYLIFDTAKGTYVPGEEGYAVGLGEGFKDEAKSYTNSNARNTGRAVVYSGSWTSHVPMHELFHALGASQGDGEHPAPYSTKGSHCVDGLDILCYPDGTPSLGGLYDESRCPSWEGYDEPEKTPLDCGYDTYFNTAPPSSSWLASYWNTGGEEDPYLINESDVRLRVGGESASVLGGEDVHLSGLVYAGGSLATTYRFDYGPTSSYGASVPNPSGAVAATREGKAVSQSLTGLTPDTVYHYRLVASNSNGSVYGPDRTFKTSGWSIASTPSSAESRRSFDVSCTARDACTAVGVSDELAMAQHWNGSEWTHQAVPSSSGTDISSLQGVSCSTASFCMAVGSSRDESFTGHAMAARWNGSTWSDVSVPSPADALGEVELREVSCSSSTACVAVGRYVAMSESEEEETRALVAHWNGSVWALGSSPRPEGVTAYSLQGVSCTSPSACIAVGESIDGPEGSTVLAERWNGTAWSVQTTANLPPGESRFEDVSCGSASVCMAVGVGRGEALAERWDGSYWTEKALGGGHAGLVSVSCLATGPCVAVGGAAALWDGSAWTPDPIEATPGTQGTISGVSCWTATSCVAAGYYLDQGRYMTLIEQRNPIVVATVTTSAATAVGSKVATLNATVNPEGYATKYQFEYGLTTSYGTKAPASPQAIGSGLNDQAVSEAISGLKQGTTYHFRIVATSVAGKSTGSDLTFTTAVDPPVAKTEEAYEVKAMGAALGGIVNPGGGETKYQFEYGTTTAYGQSVPVAALSVGSGTSNVWVAEHLEGLEPGTTYYYRVSATNKAGTAHGSDMQFSTRASEAPVFVLSVGESGEGDGQFEDPTGVAIDPEGNVWVADSTLDRVQKFNSEGEYLLQAGSPGSGSGELDFPMGVAADSEGNIWVADSHNNRVQEFDSEGNFVGQLPIYPLKSPTGVATDSEGNVWVVDTGNNRIVEFSHPQGFVLRLFGWKGSGNAQFSNPMSIAVGTEGNIWIGDNDNHRVQKFSGANYVDQFGTVGSGDGEFGGLAGLAVDPEGNVWVADQGSCRIQQFSSSGEYLQQFGECGAGEGQLGGMSEGPGMAISEGAMWIVNAGADRIEKWAPEGWW